MAGEPRIHGFFVQPYLGYGATNDEKFSSQEEYDQWLQSMADAGAEMLFYQWVTHYEKTPEWYIHSIRWQPRNGLCLLQPPGHHQRYSYARLGHPDLMDRITKERREGACRLPA